MPLFSSSFNWKGWVCILSPRDRRLNSTWIKNHVAGVRNDYSSSGVRVVSEAPNHVPGSACPRAQSIFAYVHVSVWHGPWALGHAHGTRASMRMQRMLCVQDHVANALGACVGTRTSYVCMSRAPHALSRGRMLKARVTWYTLGRLFSSLSRLQDTGQENVLVGTCGAQ